MSTVLPAVLHLHVLGLWGHATFVSSPRLLLTSCSTHAIDSHFPRAGTLFGGESVSLNVVGHGGTIGALDSRRQVVGCRTGLRGGPGGLGGSRTVDFVTMGVALGRWASVDPVRVTLGG